MTPSTTARATITLTLDADTMHEIVQILIERGRMHDHASELAARHARMTHSLDFSAAIEEGERRDEYFDQAAYVSSKIAEIEGGGDEPIGAIREL